jgi:predicted RNase H-like HicB family nuclease
MHMFDWLFRKRRAELQFTISAVIEPDEDGYHAYVPAFKGLHVDGKTEEEATKNLAQAVVVYLESLALHHDPLPIGPDLKVRYVEPVESRARLRSITVQWPSLQMSGIS